MLPQIWEAQRMLNVYIKENTLVLMLENRIANFLILFHFHQISGPAS